MSIPLIAEIVPKNGGAFAMVDDANVRGGYKTVASQAARNVIVTDDRKQGMLVFTIADGLFWQLGSDLVTWSAAVFGGAPVSTTGNIILAVSITGSDAQPVYASGDHSATPFLTIKGALASLPPFNNFKAVINVGAGTFSTEIVVPSLSGGGSIRIIGATALATLTTGVSSGTCGAGTAISGSLMTIKKPAAAANWTPGNLRGKFFLITGGTGFDTPPNYAIGCIASNTIDTAIVRVGSRAGSSLASLSVTAVDATTQFQIVTLPSIIGAGGATGTNGYIQNQGPSTNQLWFERLAINGSGDNYDAQFSSTAALFFTACTFVNGLNLDGVEYATVMSCGNAFTALSLSGFNGYVNVFGCVDSGGVFYVTSTAYVLANGNDGGGWVTYNGGCISFADSNSAVSGGTGYDFSGGCQSAKITGAIVSGTLSAYGIKVGSETFVTNDGKLLTGALGDFLLDDTIGSYAIMATGDQALRNTAQLKYTGP